MALRQPSFFDDFAREIREGEVAQDTILIQSFTGNDGCDDLFSEGALYDCEIQYKIFNITTADGEKSTTTAQIYLDAGVVVAARDKITFNGQSPKIMRVSPDPGGVVIFT